MRAEKYANRYPKMGDSRSTGALSRSIAIAKAQLMQELTTWVVDSHEN
jgi:hypothetical protein